MSLLTAARSRNGEQRGLRREKSGSARGAERNRKKATSEGGNRGDGAERGWMETEMRAQPNSEADETGGGAGFDHSGRGRARRTKAVRSGGGVQGKKAPDPSPIQTRTHTQTSHPTSPGPSNPNLACTAGAHLDRKSPRRTTRSKQKIRIIEWNWGRWSGIEATPKAPVCLTLE
jgi:hypothetical protein